MEFWEDKLESIGGLADIEMRADTTDLPHATPFSQVATVLGTIMREKCPVPPGGIHSLVFHIADNEDVPSFLMRSQESWTSTTSVHPGNNPLQNAIFRKAIMDGLPKKVQRKMQQNPDLPGCGDATWSKHLLHHMKTYREQDDLTKAQETIIQTQLEKLQLEEAKRKKITDKKSKLQLSVITATNQPHSQIWDVGQSI